MGIQQRDEQAICLGIARTCWIGQGRDHDAHEQVVTTVAALLIGGVDVSPIRTVRQELACPEREGGGHADQDIGFPATRPLDHLKAGAAAIQEQKHVSADAAEQAKGTDTFARVAGPEARIDHGVGTTRAQVHALHLRKGTGASRCDCAR